MRVTLLFFAAHRRAAGLAEAELMLPEGATARDAAREAARRHNLELGGSMVAVNEAYAEPDRPLRDGDVVAFIPPVAGGVGEPDHFLVTPEPLDLLGLHARLVRPQWGAQAVFTGTTRSPNRGLSILRLEYEAYEPMCLGVMADLVAQARRNHDLGAAVVAHRVGIVRPAEVSIFVGLASAHRGAAMAALPGLVDALKARLPVWKLEVAENGERWVEGSITAPAL